MNAELKQTLGERFTEAKAKEKELYELMRETERWAAPTIKRFEESRSAWCKQMEKTKMLSAWLEEDK